MPMVSKVKKDLEIFNINRKDNMEKFTVTKEVNFCAAHRLLGYDGPCSNIHGHNYQILITVQRLSLSEGRPLDSLGMVLDFKEIREFAKSWIDENLDHALILNQEDVDLINFFDRNRMKLYLMRGNPTAENLAHLIKNRFHNFLQSNGNPNRLRVTKVQVFETLTSSAEVSNADE